MAENRTYLTPKEVGEIFGLKVGTLSQWRNKGIGPDYFKLGKAVRYKREEIEKFIESTRIRTHRPREDF